MRVVFMGTPEFAVPTLNMLLEEHEVLAVFTQPDRAKGRSKKPVFSPVKEVAVKHGIPVYQPQRLRKLEELDVLRGLQPDVIVVAAFGQILPKEILDLPAFGCINVHASLLPAYRGAAPINHCIADRVDQTGVTIMQMDVGLDTGDMLKQGILLLDDKETATTLTDKLSIMGAELLSDVLKELEAGTCVPVKQDDALSSYAGMMTKDMGYVDFKQSATVIEALIRALESWPTVTCLYQGKRIKLYEADVQDDNGNEAPGTVLEADGDRLVIACAQGALMIRELQPEGKRRMKTADFLRGNAVKKGERFEAIG